MVYVGAQSVALPSQQCHLLRLLQSDPTSSQSFSPVLTMLQLYPIFTGDYTPDLRALLAADIIIATPEKWDGISRNWQSRAYVKKVGLLIIDEIHLLGADRGPILEVIVSRMRSGCVHAICVVLEQAPKQQSLPFYFLNRCFHCCAALTVRGVGSMP